MSDHRSPELSREKITLAALQLLDSVGLEDMSMRRLATELGVRPPALYWHFRDKRQLLDQMADTIVQSAGMGPPLEEETWQDWLSRRGRAYREALLRYRDGARVVSTAHTLNADTLRHFNAELTAMTAAGFTPALALRTITIVNHYVTGYVLREQADRPNASTAQALMSQLPDEASATLVAALQESAGGMGADVFEHGLRVLIEGTTVVIDHQ